MSATESLIERLKADRKEFNRWFATTYCDADGQFTHLPRWFKPDMWEAWRTGRSPLHAELEALRSRCERMEKALAPFAKYADITFAPVNIRDSKVEIGIYASDATAEVTAGDFRRAARALQEGKP